MTSGLFSLPIVPAAIAATGRGDGRISYRDLFLTPQEMAAVAAATISDRDQLLVRTLAETGERLGEVLALTAGGLGPGCVVLPIEKRRVYEEKAVYLNPH